MLSFTGGRIFLVPGPTDMRKSYDGLSGVVRDRLGTDPQSRDLCVFCNRARNRLKVLLYDESGAWVLAKRLDVGTFAWPGESAAGARIEHDEHRLLLLLRGFDAERITPRRWARRKAG